MSRRSPAPSPPPRSALRVTLRCGRAAGKPPPQGGAVFSSYPSMSVFVLSPEEFGAVAATLRTARDALRRPLFPRYLFVRLDIGRDRWLSVNSTTGVSRLFTQAGRPVAVPFGVVENLLAHSDAGLICVKPTPSKR